VKKYNVAILGATGNVGSEMLKILLERNFPLNNLYLVASHNSKGKIVSYNNTNYTVNSADEFDFSGCNIVISSIGSLNIKKYVDKITPYAVLIDNSSAFRMDTDVPLIIPEVNLNALPMYKNRNIIANPNCSTISMLVALSPLHKVFNIKRIIVSTYQSVSGAGLSAINELKNQVKQYVNNEDFTNEVFPYNIAFNCIPAIDSALPSNSTKEEEKMCLETQKILHANIKIHANCVRVPTLQCHGAFVNIETAQPINKQLVINAYNNAKGVQIMDNLANNVYATPWQLIGSDDVYISRIKEDSSVENGISLWCVSDNIRKGSALNTVQIAEELIKIGI
jgi:aspartate-semialdehyde dehydrogenase